MSTIAKKKIKLGGVEVECLDSPLTEAEVKPQPKLKKEDRAKLSSDKWITIQKEIETGLETEYAEVTIDEKDLAALSNTYELQQQNQALENHLHRWDLVGVFTLVGEPDPSTPDEYPTKDLLAEWPNTTIAEVLFSNEFYHLHFGAIAPWVRQNLELSHNFILNSCAPEMRKQVQDQLNKYKPHQLGGPLTFIVLMNLVQVNSEGAITHLIDSIKGLDIKNYDGEDVTLLVAQIRGGIRCIQMVNRSAVPSTLYRDVLSILQKSSTPDFNKAFELNSLKAQTSLVEGAGGKLRINTDVETILTTAVQLYKTHLQQGEWLGKDHRAQEAAFPSIQTKQPTRSTQPIRCFNCGRDGHGVNDCDKPRDEDRIKKAKEKYQQAKKAAKEAASGRGNGSGGGRGRGGGGRGRGRGGRGTPNPKWGPPLDHENNKRFIKVQGGHIVPHTYNPQTRRWIADHAFTASDAPSTGAASTSTLNTNTVSSTAATPTQSNRTADQQAAANRTRIANLQQQVNSTFTELLRNS